MKMFRISGISLFILATAFCLTIMGCFDDGDSAPANITGTWVGTVIYQNESLPSTMVVTQTGSTVNGTIEVAGLGGTSFTGTYENGTLAVEVDGTTAILTFRGNKATGTFTDGTDVYTVDLTKQ